MTVETLINHFLLSESMSPSYLAITINFLFSIVFITPVIFSYIRIRPFSNYSESFVQGLVLFSFISCGLIMIIGSSVSRAFGLFGVLSIVRFRTALKSPIDSIYTFWALGIGFASGTENYGLGFFLSVGGMALSFLIDKLKLGKNRREIGTIIVKVELSRRDFIRDQIDRIFNENGIKFSINHMVVGSNPSEIDIYYETQAKNKDFNEVAEIIRSYKGVLSVQVIAHASPSYFAGV